MHGHQIHCINRIVLQLTNINAAGISDTFQASPISYIGGGWVRGGWGGQWGRMGAVDEFFHTFEQISSHCVFIKVHRQPQFTCQADTVADSSLTAGVALLVCPRGTTHSIVDCHEFTGSQTRMMPVKADLVICSSAIGVSE